MSLYCLDIAIGNSVKHIVWIMIFVVIQYKPAVNSYETVDRESSVVVPKRISKILKYHSDLFLVYKRRNDLHPTSYQDV